jgi:DNA-directed RNA polymerase alpha subunit
MDGKVITVGTASLSELPAAKLIALLEFAEEITFIFPSTLRAEWMVEDLIRFAQTTGVTDNQILALGAPIGLLNLSPRCHNLLLSMNMQHAWELCEKDEEEIFKRKLLGPAALGEIKKALAAHSLRLGMREQIAKVKHLLPQREP